MRIENVINEIRGPEALEKRDAEVKRRRATAGGEDVVEISQAARSLGSQTVTRADLASAGDVRQARVQAVRQRVANGYYDRPEILKAIAEAMLSSGVVDGVGAEAQQVRSARQGISQLPDTREERVAQARERVASGHYTSAGATAKTVDRLLESLLG